jgi:hypothetical protein
MNEQMFDECIIIILKQIIIINVNDTIFICKFDSKFALFVLMQRLFISINRLNVVFFHKNLHHLTKCFI